MRIILLLVIAGWSSLAQAETALSKVKAYLNSLSTIQASFQQVSSNGQRNSGKIYMKRPGRLRMDFASGKFRITVSGDMMLFENLKTGRQQPIGLSSTPAAILLKPKLDLDKDVQLSVRKQQKNTVIVQAQPRGTNQKILLKFRYPKVQLQGWQITDPQRITTQVVLSNIKENTQISNRLFESE